MDSKTTATTSPATTSPAPTGVSPTKGGEKGAPASSERQFRVLTAGVSGKDKNGKDVDFYHGALINESLLTPVHDDLDALVERGVLELHDPKGAGNDPKRSESETRS